MRILLADDQEIVRSAVRLVLEQEMPLSRIYESAEMQEMLTTVKRVQPDLLLLDWELPGRRSGDIIAIIHAACKHTKIIVLDGSCITVREVLAAGADAVISKIYPERLLETLRTFIDLIIVNTI